VGGVAGVVTLKVGSLFSGIGGLEKGFADLGCDVVFQVELDAPCREVLARHWPDVKRYDDIREVTYERLKRDLGRRADVDVLVGGWPCQDISLAGPRLGLAGARSGLFYEFARLVAEISPRWLVAENVPGLLTSGCNPPCPGGCVETHGGDMGAVIGTLGELGYGYAWRVLDAQHFGVPQRRHRIFIVGHLGAPWTASPAVLLEPDSSPGDPAESDEAWEEDAEALGDGPDELGDEGWTPDLAKPLLSNRQGGQRTTDVEGVTFVAQPVAKALVSPDNGPRFDASSENLVVQEPVYAVHNGEDVLVSKDVAQPVLATKGFPGAVTFRKSQRAHHADDAETWVEDETANTLNAFENHNAERTTHAIVTPLDLSQACRTDTATGVGTPGTGIGEPGGPSYPVGYTKAVPAMIQELSVRRLTPLECERLQGFPDGWTDGQSDTARYKQLGNAVAVVCSRWIAKRLLEVDRDLAR
jgi:DNA (cytosine-5)-methyltransferase 1